MTVLKSYYMDEIVAEGSRSFSPFEDVARLLIVQDEAQELQRISETLGVPGNIALAEKWKAMEDRLARMEQAADIL